MWVPLWLCGFHYGSVGSIVGLWSHCALCSHSVFGVSQCIWGPAVPCVPIVDLGSRGVFGARLCRVAGAAPIAVSP